MGLSWPPENTTVKLVAKTLELILPARCLLCGLPGKGKKLCRPCHCSLPTIEYNCPQCGLPMKQPEKCFQCLKNPPPCDWTIAGLAYEFPVNHLVQRFKFNRDLASGQVLKEALHNAISRSIMVIPHTPMPELIVPVPLHFTRQWRRAFNQAEFLARGLSRSLQVPCRSDLIHRIRRTPAQSGLAAKERRSNLRGAFSCKEAAFAHVAVVDDVMTTGSTLFECARVLKRAGVASVSVWVAARAPSPIQ